MFYDDNSFINNLFKRFLYLVLFENKENFVDIFDKNFCLFLFFLIILE